MTTANGDDSYCLVLTTLGSKQDAQSLVRRLVDERLVACGTIAENALSIYEWQGKLEETEEVLVLLKTRNGLWERLRTAIEELHPYDVPELLAISVDRGLPAYLAWLADQTTQESQ